MYHVHAGHHLKQLAGANPGKINYASGGIGSPVNVPGVGDERRNRLGRNGRMHLHDQGRVGDDRDRRDIADEIEAQALVKCRVNCVRRCREEQRVAVRRRPYRRGADTWSRCGGSRVALGLLWRWPLVVFARKTRLAFHLVLAAWGRREPFPPPAFRRLPNQPIIQAIKHSRRVAPLELFVAPREQARGVNAAGVIVERRVRVEIVLRRLKRTGVERNDVIDVPVFQVLPVA
jgi:hypothetical protein